MKRLTLITIVSLAAAFGGCKSTPSDNSPANGNSNNAPVNSPSPAATNAAPPVTNTNINAAKTPDGSPKRISFAKGANWGASNVDLAPGASAKFVVAARSGQLMTVESSSKDLSVNLRKGKAETTEDFGFLSAELQANGDYVFEVSNSTKKPIKASIKVTIESDEPIDEEPAEDDSAAPVKKN